MRLLTLASLILFCSCHFPVRVLNDAAIEKHYANRPAKPQLRFIKYRNFKIHHAVIGDSTKPLLVIIHGSPGAWYSSMKLLDDSSLQRNFRLVSVDRVGFGKSEYGVSEPSIRAHVEYISRIVNQYNHQGQIYLMGSSYGAPIAASFAMQYPDLVKELYLVSPVIDPASEKMFWFSYVGRIAPVSLWLPEYLNVAGDEKFAHRRELRSLKAHWGEITCKTYVLMGANDHLASLRNLDFARRKLTSAYQPEFILLPKTGHAIIWQQTNLLVSLLMKQDSAMILH
ncbi:MAG TPA: alpha/beta hydrolase [Chitinophagaceae bacterium]